MGSKDEVKLTGKVKNFLFTVLLKCTYCSFVMIQPRSMNAMILNLLLLRIVRFT